ncbi:peptidase S74, partial [Escherichia coli]|nr:peptidase S74 [Escherichia coli]
RHDGRVEARNRKITYKIGAATAEFANTSTSSDNTTVSIKGSQHTPLVLTSNNTIKNLSIGFKVDDVDQKYLGIAGDGDLYFGSYSDHTKNSKVITQAKLDSGVTVGGKTTFSD